MPDLYSPQRLHQAAQGAKEAGIDALLITPGSDLRYLTGYVAQPSERLTCLIIPADGRAILVVPQLEMPAAQASPAAELPLEMREWQETDDPFALAAKVTSDTLGRRPMRVGVANRMWAEHCLALNAAFGNVEIVPAGPVMSALRIYKSAAEVDALLQAAQAIDRVHERMAEFLRAGRTEAEVGRDIAEAIIAEGHESVAFVTVGSGPNAASPHHRVGNRTVEAGDAVVVDIGGVTADGYCSDETRTYTIGQPPREFVDYYNVVQRAQQAACDAVRPGVPAELVDAAARQIIATAGYGPNFTHRVGHGIGIDVHEDPYLVAGNATPLEAGMVFSIEPGIYLPGQHGARIEDIVVCTHDGVQRLNSVRRDLVAL